MAIVGAASLKGKEVAEILRERNFPAVDIRLLDDDESLGQLEAVGDEMNFIQSIRSEQFERVDFTFFASDPRSTRNNWRAARDLGDTIVDLSFALEDEAGASVRSPWIERQTGQPITPELQPGPVVVAHPAATVLALLALRSEKAGKIQRMVATVFEPASENGQKGMDELHEQTVNLLSFQELPKNVFDIQVAFNMVARYGQRSELALEAVSQRIRKHYRHIAQRRSRACAASAAGAGLPWPRLFGLLGNGEASRDRRVLAGPGGRACGRQRQPGRYADQCECRWTGRHPGLDHHRHKSQKRRVALGNYRQSARCRFDCGRMRRDHDRIPPEGSDSMKPMRRRTVAGGSGARRMVWLRAGCGYHTAGSAVELPQNVHTIAIPGFVSQSQTFRIEQLLTDAVVREFNARTQYHVIHESKGDADAVLKATVLAASATPLAYDSQPGARPAL